jgi:fructokinase
MDSANAKVIVGLGEILWDLLPAGKQLGGAPANFAFHAQQLGAAGIVASAVGDDDLGREILDRLKGLGLTINHVAIDREHPTGTVSVKLDDKGVPDYIIHTNVAWDYIALTDSLLDLARKCDAVCFGTLAQRSPVSARTIEGFLDATRPDCLRVFDINLRQSYFSAALIDQMLKRTHILKLNDQELPVVCDLLQLPGCDEPSRVDAIRSRYALRGVALTRGEKGSALYTGARPDEQPAAKVEVVDTVGAGDAFTAVLVNGLLRNWPLDKTHALASRVAGHVCSQRGATPRLPPGFVSL